VESIRPGQTFRMRSLRTVTPDSCAHREAIPQEAQQPNLEHSEPSLTSERRKGAQPQQPNLEHSERSQTSERRKGETEKTAPGNSATGPF